MTTFNVTSARKQLYTIIKDVNSSHNPVHISGKNGSAVILSEDDWNAIEETLYLSSFPGMVKSIKKDLAEPIKKSSTKLDW